jgi:hypothetical protein
LSKQKVGDRTQQTIYRKQQRGDRRQKTANKNNKIQKTAKQELYMLDRSAVVPEIQSQETADNKE